MNCANTRNWNACARCSAATACPSRRSIRPSGSSSPPGWRTTRWNGTRAYLVLGAIAGFLAGMFGVGGGLVLVPVLLFLFDSQHFPAEHVMHLALGTSMAAILFTSLASLREHHRHGAVNWRVVRNITPGILLGTGIGALLAASIPTRGSGDILRTVRVFRGCADSARHAPARCTPIARRSRHDADRHAHRLVEQPGLHRRRIHRRPVPGLVQCPAAQCDRHFRRDRLSGRGRRHDRLCGHRHWHPLPARLQLWALSICPPCSGSRLPASSPHRLVQKPRIT